jgi:anti-sigma regulatory factor (Ser/Thr protein kinase)
MEFPPGGGRTCVSDGVAFARATVADWHLASNGGTASTDAVLVAAELLANAVDHAGGPLALELGRRHGWLRVAVSDPDSALLRRADPYVPDRPHGHGLMIVDRIAADWGTSPDRGGKTVWADLPLPPAPAGPDPPLDP